MNRENNIKIKATSGTAQNIYDNLGITKAEIKEANYRIWELKCNEFMLKQYGLGIDDLPDMNWFNWFDLDQYTPEEAVKIAINYVNSGEWL